MEEQVSPLLKDAYSPHQPAGSRPSHSASDPAPCRCTWEGGGRWFKSVSPCHPRTWLTLATPDTGEWASGWEICLCLSSSLLLYLLNKSATF